MKKYFILLLVIFLAVTPIFFACAEYTLEMEYPSVGGVTPQGGLVSYIRYVYLFALGIVGLAAFGAMVYGGFLYMLSGTNIVSQQEAKDWMRGALSGLVLALAAYLIMSTINPDLVSIQAPKVLPFPSPAAPAMVGGTFMNVNDCGKNRGECYGDNACTGIKSAGQCCCIINISAPTASPATQYQWFQTTNCLDIKKGNYDDSFCSPPKPGSNYICCGA